MGREGSSRAVLLWSIDLDDDHCRDDTAFAYLLRRFDIVRQNGVNGQERGNVFRMKSLIDLGKSSTDRRPQMSFAQQTYIICRPA